MTTLCVSPFCGLRDQHLDDCDGDGFYGGDCTGCLPARAADGLYLCGRCTRRLSHDAWLAAWRYRALGQVLAASGKAGEYTTGSTRDPGINLHPAVVEARDGIKTTLVALVRVICEERCFMPPRASVVDLARFIGTSRDWLAAHRAADEHARDLRDVATDPQVWRLAFPSSTDRLYIGDCPLPKPTEDGSRQVCGTRLYQRADDSLVTCGGCGAFGVIEWWQRTITGETGGIVDAYAAAAHLSVRWARPVDPTTVRSWTWRPTTGVVAVGKDARGRSLLDLDELVTYARKLWGPARDERNDTRSDAS